MSDILYGFFVKPIELVVEIIFSLMFRAFGNAGIAIVFVSIAIQLLVLPMYKRADALQDQERNKQKEMKPWVDHIKKTFKGDERFMMLSAYYREAGYSQLSSVKSSLSLLLQIPFFIAAYNYLSNLSVLKGASFLWLSDLSAPDATFMTGSFVINVLPILMTVFNIISGIIYTKGFPLKDKIQTYGLALIFLVVLYNCPSGLVLYWTLNNLFSLGKNVVMKILAHDREPVSSSPVSSSPVSSISSNIFNVSSIVLTLLLGFIIPLSVVSTSPTEFVSTNYSPLGLVFRTGVVYAGIILLWIRIFYYLAREKGKMILSYAMAIITAIAIVDFYAFGRNYGTMSVFLQYDEEFINPMTTKLLSMGLILLVGMAVFVIIKMKPAVMKVVFQICLLTGVVLLVYQGVGVSAQAPVFKTSYTDTKYDKILPLSKKGKNVIVLMLDRAIGAFVPYLFDEKPQLEQMYDGFTFYPNTLSFGTTTNFATPALFGGYEYVPVKINERKDETLKDKQDEALSVMPRIFLENDYKVVVTDPPYAGYKYSPDISVFDQYKNQGKGLDAYVLGGKYAGETGRVFAPSYEKKQLRNFIYYSLMRAAPAAFHGKIYDHGDYFLNEEFAESTAASRLFLDSYTVLESLPKITDIKDDDSNNFLMMQNETTHEPVVLSKPDYTPSVLAVNTTEYENNHIVNGRLLDIHEEMQQSHYDVNMAALLKVGEWLDYLKKEGVYDNTRIIITSDHGRQLVNFKDLVVDDGVHHWIDIESYNPLYMVKDFGAKGFKTSDEFMTNADTAFLATTGLIEKAKNPFSGKIISNEDKKGDLYVTTSWNYEIDKGNGYTFETDDGDWYLVGRNMLDPKNWKCLGKGIDNGK